MSYVINAWLEGDGLRLSIMDADTRVVRMRWAYQKEPGAVTDHAGGAEASLHELFKSLFLLACTDRLSASYRSGLMDLGDACLGCDGCLENEALPPLPEVGASGRRAGRGAGFGD